LQEQYTEEYKMWKNYNKKSDTVLMFGNLGEQGDGLELHVVEIPRCK
jgi:hypothetical protein